MSKRMSVVLSPHKILDTTCFSYAQQHLLLILRWFLPDISSLFGLKETDKCIVLML